MKTLEKGQDKIQKICIELRKEALEPAKKEAEQIVNAARSLAQEIVREAEEKAARLTREAVRNIEQERNVFHASMSQGIKQSLEALRQDVEKKLFNDQLTALMKKGTEDPHLVAKLVDAIVQAVAKEGISADLSVAVPKHVSPAEVNKLLAEGILSSLREKSVSIGHFEGGAQIRLHDNQLTIDLSDAALKELLSRYVRKDFRKLIFAVDE